MPFVVGLSDSPAFDRAAVGGKCAALAVAWRNGFTVPRTVCVTTEAYRAFVGAGRLEGTIAMEIDRKDFADMRWEELWDAALRIRNRFLTTPVPPEIENQVAGAMAEFPAGSTLAVRSSSVAEDSSGASFAGLHESYVNVRAVPLENLMDHVKLVWASLWSDRALLYRREMGLDVSRSAMAVVVQELVTGPVSGVMFTQSPEQRGHMLIEAVYGLNQGLVDGTVEPDRWLLERPSGRIVQHTGPTERREFVTGEGELLTAIPVPGALSALPPLAPAQVSVLAEFGMKLEDIFGAPQDIEWTLPQQGPVLLQCRPITAGRASDDERSWYLSLRRSLESLRDLRTRVEEELIPQMDRDTARREMQDIAALSDAALDEEIRAREELLSRWEEVYREECIPLAHGVRLFGEVYNDLMRPDDPFEFVLLLTGTAMESLARNGELEELARELPPPVGAGVTPLESFDLQVETFLARHGDLMFGGLPEVARREALLEVITRYASRSGPAGDGVQPTAENLKAAFLTKHPDGPGAAEDLLDLARASYRLRDDDNIHLGRIRALVHEARLLREKRAGRNPEPPISHSVPDPNYHARPLFPKSPVPKTGAPRTRQIVGQPASRGIGRGRARVISSTDDLQRFREGEILVCDAIDPTMTWVCPVAAGIVERRGGMLIHGAIIAREYGIPCVTGVPGATERIRTGDRVTVDGFLGIVVVQGPGT